MTAHIAQTTFIEFDRKNGVIKVYDLKTGKLLYPLKIKPCNP